MSLAEGMSPVPHSNDKYQNEPQTWRGMRAYALASRQPSRHRYF